MLMASLPNDNRRFQRPKFRVAPNKTYPPLIDNANAALPLAVTAQRLQMIARRQAQIVESLGRVDGQQLGRVRR
jgi:hypothetical protein